MSTLRVSVTTTDGRTLPLMVKHGVGLAAAWDRYAAAAGLPATHQDPPNALVLAFAAHRTARAAGMISEPIDAFLDLIDEIDILEEVGASDPAEAPVSEEAGPGSGLDPTTAPGPTPSSAA
jgi:hypothetical protein